MDAAVGGRKRVLAASIAFSVGPVLYNRQEQRMPSRALVHFPEPATPTIVELTLSARPARGDEFPAGWTVCEYNLVGDVHEGEQYDFAVWVMPRSDGDSHLGDCGGPEQP